MRTYVLRERGGGHRMIYTNRLMKNHIMKRGIELYFLRCRYCMYDFLDRSENQSYKVLFFYILNVVNKL